MNTTKIEKLLKKEIKKIDKDLFDRVENIRVFAQSKSAKKPQYCIIFDVDGAKTSLNYFVKLKDDEVKDVKAIYFDALGDFVSTYAKISEEKPEEKKKSTKVEDLLKKRWKKIKKDL